MKTDSLSEFLIGGAERQEVETLRQRSQENFRQIEP